MFPTHESVELTLVETMAGLCSMSHAPAIRNQSITADSKMIDNIALDNMAGILNAAAVDNYAPHISGLTQSPIAESRIRGGFGEYNKGMMKLLFRVGKENFSTDYLHVLGFITENDLESEISEHAVFVPICSWRETQTVKSGLSRTGRPVVTSQLSRRNDYIFNDGSLDQTSGWVTIRPSDVLTGISNNLLTEDTLEQISESHGVSRDSIHVGSVASSLAINSVISKRSNINPTRYAGELLGSIAKTTQDISNNHLGNVHNEKDNDIKESDYYQSTASRAIRRETKTYEDPFMSIMLEGGSPAQYRGSRISDIVYAFPNFEDTIPPDGFITLDRTRQNVIDFREIRRRFGTSTVAEVIATEIVFNILDVITLNGLGIFHCAGTNCERETAGSMHRLGDDSMSNISVIPTHYLSLADGDVEIHNRADNAADDIRNQIMAKLNGRGMYVATPVQFRIESELLGMTSIFIRLPTDENPNPPEIDYSFPTYSFSRFSPILTNIDGHRTMCDGIYKNLSSYLNR